MKQPTKTDFDVAVDDAGVHVLFKPGLRKAAARRLAELGCKWLTLVFG
jgi:hypothetical protein